MKTKKLWTEEELELLRNNAHTRIDKLCVLFPNRSRSAVYQKRHNTFGSVGRPRSVKQKLFEYLDRYYCNSSLPKPSAMYKTLLKTEILFSNSFYGRQITIGTFRPIYSHYRKLRKKLSLEGKVNWFDGGCKVLEHYGDLFEKNSPKQHKILGPR